MHRIPARPLTAESFAPFGEVLGPSATAAAFAAAPPARPTLRVSDDLPLVHLPLRVTRMERHPWSAQSFIPMTDARFLVVVAEPAADGTPDPARLAAFIAQGAALCYRPNLWHHGMSVLDAGARFVVLMATAGRPDDDIFADLADPVEIAA
jgi:ureidoglycolate lyase